MSNKFKVLKKNMIRINYLILHYCFTRITVSRGKTGSAKSDLKHTVKNNPITRIMTDRKYSAMIFGSAITMARSRGGNGLYT